MLNDPKMSGKSSTVTIVINANNSNSAMASLKKTLTKSNLRSIEPRRVEDSLEWHFDEREFAFSFKIINKNIKNTFLRIKNNWIIVKQSQLVGFFIQDFGNFFKNA